VKIIIYILTSFFALASCNNSTHKETAVSTHYDAHLELEKASEELNKFDKVIIGYYNQIETDATDVITQTDNLIKKVTSETDSNEVRWNKLGSLFDLRAETFYKKGDFKSSIKEIYKAAKNNQENFGGKLSFGPEDCIHLACNYVKLNDFPKAKAYLDSAGRGSYIADYVNANYYEVVGNKTKALQAYIEIKNNKSIAHYYYYQGALKCIEELNKPAPKLLNEIFYPSARSDNPICKDDNERRTKIFELINDLPEVKACKNCDVVSIYKEPDETNSSKYWVKVGHKNASVSVSKFDFFVDTLTYEIQYYDTKTDRLLTLPVWRKQ
jgi:hypothetical protein